MIEKISLLWPEISLFLATCVVMVVGLSPRYSVRKWCGPIVALGLMASVVLAEQSPRTTGPLPWLLPYTKALIGIVGLMLVLLVEGTVDRQEESDIAGGRRAFNPLRTNRAEFYSFFLFSLTGAMLCATADNLVWLFLALELTSLPTYIMVTISTRGGRSYESGVKYFFLGALGAATFLYGFTLLYGGTGSTNLVEIQAVLAEQSAAGGINSIVLAGLLLAVLGVCFKIAAVPMHFYTPDVYEGAAAPVSAFLAFVPKTAGFIAIILLASAAGWTHSPDGGAGGGSLPEALRVMLWVIAALTMTVGNVLAILQRNIKRILAYSSIAHSGYMLVGVIAGPGPDGAGITRNGLAAVLFYLACYGVMNLGAFAVVGCLERRGRGAEPREVESIDDLRGLCATRPWLGWSMVLCSLSLLGFPPLLGFLGKFPLFTSAIAAGEVPLVIVLGLNSAIAAYYYIRLAAYPLLEAPGDASADVRGTPFLGRGMAAVLSAAGVVVLIFFADRLMSRSADAARLREAREPIAVVSPPTDQTTHAK